MYKRFNTIKTLEKVSFFFTTFVATLSFFTVSSLCAEEYISQQAFIEKELGSEYDAHLVWITSELRAELEQKISDSPEGARLRYWQANEQRVWIVEKIGRDKLITMGFVVEADRIKKFEVLAFRESRGYEIKYPVFTQKVSGLRLTEDFSLDQSVDNITGATLSVNAVKKAARLVLYMDAFVQRSE